MTKAKESEKSHIQVLDDAKAKRRIRYVTVSEFVIYILIASRVRND